MAASGDVAIGEWRASGLASQSSARPNLRRGKKRAKKTEQMRSGRVLPPIKVAMMAAMILAGLGCCLMPATVGAASADTVASIVQAALNNTRGYDRLVYMADTFGIRITGSKGLANMISWASSTMTSDGTLSRITLEEVPVRNWVRSDVESLFLYTDLTEPMKLGVVALGGSVGTQGTLQADGIVLQSFDEAHALGADAIKGKIVIWNQPWQGYGVSVAYRTQGAAVAASYGAVASLTRSVTDFSLYTLHTGKMNYKEGTPKIPSAAVTVEDAELLQRYQDRGQGFSLSLQLGCYDAPRTVSHNIIAELPGTSLASELVIIGGHIDSWSRGAQDDGGAFVSAWEGLNVLASLGLRPKRTIRLVGWTSEEWGGEGGEAYFAAHLKELKDTAFAIESDMGIFVPDAFHFQGSNESMALFQQMCDSLSPWYQINVSDVGGVAEDIQPLANAGVPAASLVTVGDPSNGHYWYANKPFSLFLFQKNIYFFPSKRRYHHTLADQETVVDHVNFNQIMSVFASMAYTLADAPFRLVGQPNL
ncbi:MAG: M20/M25/M40 family metallo-hydrolase [archaeon]|nr:M20/M25/M40 family metallo-hydrolase [archaeon]